MYPALFLMIEIRGSFDEDVEKSARVPCNRTALAVTPMEKLGIEAPL